MFEKRVIQFFGFLLKLFMAPKLTGIAIFIMLVCVFVLCAACGAPEADAAIPLENQPAELLRVEALSHNIIRYIDYEAGVICYIKKYGSGSALSCLPLSETRMDETKDLP